MKDPLRKFYRKKGIRRKKVFWLEEAYNKLLETLDFEPTEILISGTLGKYACVKIAIYHGNQVDKFTLGRVNYEQRRLQSGGGIWQFKNFGPIKEIKWTD